MKFAVNLISIALDNALEIFLSSGYHPDQSDLVWRGFIETM